MPSCLNNHVDIPQSRRTLRRRTRRSDQLPYAEPPRDLERTRPPGACALHPDLATDVGLADGGRTWNDAQPSPRYGFHENTDCEFTASGTTIEFEGHRAVLSDVDGDSENETEKEELLPARSR